MAIIATAGWAVPKTIPNHFGQQGSSLTRYATAFPGVEINSTFYRRHQQSTFERWATSVPDTFKFSVKIPKEITHDRAMVDIAEAFRNFLQDIAPLDTKRGPLLCQLPPSLAFDADVFAASFKAMRAADQGQIVIEVRHTSWKSEEAVQLMKEFEIDLVLADPAVVWAASDFPKSPRYVRLHGKPKIYYSSYTNDEILAFSKLLGPDAWCVFDNTASGAAAENGFQMVKLLMSKH